MFLEEREGVLLPLLLPEKSIAQEEKNFIIKQATSFLYKFFVAKKRFENIPLLHVHY